MNNPVHKTYINSYVVVIYIYLQFYAEEMLKMGHR